MKLPLDRRAYGPLLVFSLAFIIGFATTRGPRARFEQAIVQLNDAERSALPSLPGVTVANAVWALGSDDAVKNMLRSELDRLPETEGRARARVLVRFGIIDSNPDGQAAVFFQACVSDPSLCERAPLIAAAERETRARLVEPGRHLPLYLLAGHP